MQTKDVLYAAVGAPVVAVRRVGDKVSGIRARLNEGANEYGKAAEKTLTAWAAEGEKVVGRIADRKMVDDLTAKVDLDQAKEQVTRLRDQLEDMLETWRTSFRPEGTERAGQPAPKTAAAPAAKPGSGKPAAQSAKKPAADKSTGAKSTTTSKSTGNKASAAKTPKSTAAKTSSGKSSPAS